MYRRRSTGEASLIQSSSKKVGWYFDYFTYLVDWAVKYYRHLHQNKSETARQILHHKISQILLSLINRFLFVSSTKEIIEFDSKLVCGEDIKVLLTLLAQKMKLGVVTKCKVF